MTVFPVVVTDEHLPPRQLERLRYKELFQNFVFIGLPSCSALQDSTLGTARTAWHAVNGRPAAELGFRLGVGHWHSAVRLGRLPHSGSRESPWATGIALS